MKERNHKKRYNNNKKREEVQEQFVVTPEIAEDIDNILSEAVNTIKSKYPGSEEAMDTFLSALAQAMTDIISQPTKNDNTQEEKVEGRFTINPSFEETTSSCEPVIPDYDKAIDKMREKARHRDKDEEKKDKKKKDKDLINVDLEDFLNDDDDDDDIQVKTYGKIKNAGSACSSWYKVYYTVDDDEDPKFLKVRALDEDDAESKALKKLGDDCTIDFIDELDEEDDEYEDEVPVGRPDDDDDWDDDDENYSLARAAFHRNRKRF